MSEISKLRPTKRQRIMDLIKIAGMDVSDWKNFKGGIKRAASNPKYCYSWSFVQPKAVVILNLWYDDLKNHNGRIVQRLGLRKDAREYSDLGRPEWQRRAIQMDQAIQAALQTLSAAHADVFLAERLRNSLFIKELKNYDQPVIVAQSVRH